MKKEQTQCKVSTAARSACLLLLWHAQKAELNHASVQAPHECIPYSMKLAGTVVKNRSV